jgi:uncharacterized protein YlxW (UPF0749 family)
MSATNYLSIIAILISIVSLIVAIRSAQFGHAAKSSELRAAVLAKVTEASARLAHVAELQSEIRVCAEQAKDFEWFKRASKINSEQLRQRADQAYRKLAAMPVNEGVRIHQELFHEACELNELTIGYERNIQELRDAQAEGGEGVTVQA